MKKFAFLLLASSFLILSCKKEDYREIFVGTYAMVCDKYQSYPVNPDLPISKTTSNKDITVRISTGNDNEIIVDGKSAPFSAGVARQATFSIIRTSHTGDTFGGAFYPVDSLRFSYNDVSSSGIWTEACRGIKID